MTAIRPGTAVDRFVTVDRVTRHFVPRLTMGERIAAGLGAAVDTRIVRAVDGVSLTITKGEVLGLAGESGCGKSTLGRMIAGIMPPTAGAVHIEGEPVMRRTARPTKATTRVQMIFQDPFASLNPRMRIGDAIAEGPIAHKLVTRSGAPAYVADWLRRVGLAPELAGRFPHQFSGGQRQRIAIARALAMQPDVVVCDEPVASLDVSIQAQIINLFLGLKRSLGLTMLFISHDLGVVRHISDRVAIMYLGRVVEVGRTADIYSQPQHPYTQGLLDSIPRLVLGDNAQIGFRQIAGELPSPLAPPPGCHFHQRCGRAAARCRTEAPVLAEHSGRLVACHFPGAEAAFAANPPG